MKVSPVGGVQTLGRPSGVASRVLGSRISPRKRCTAAWQLLLRSIMRAVADTFRLSEAWLAVAAICLLDLVWAMAVRFTVSIQTPVLILLFDLVAATTLLRQLRANTRIALVTEVIALWICCAGAGEILTYLAATPALPLQDDLLDGVDRALFFSWPDLTDWVWNIPR